MRRCILNTHSVFQYIWEAPGQTDFSLSDFNSVFGKIRGGTMKGGKTYTVQLIATVTSNTDYSTTASLTITTASQPLVAKIKP